jgi:hypothetical protein
MLHECTCFIGSVTGFETRVLYTVHIGCRLVCIIRSFPFSPKNLEVCQQGPDISLGI